ncbi:hypothetical protein F2Q69_00009453 [Brassica cretica]|uniref:Uncharacterized protein n=1 Tax=Brassica cretica TaxID=69181 RepID=A0A8S9P615_BRACR|nr:hypothetical protein F2Q69_00009453 [Brassica cretica]
MNAVLKPIRFWQFFWNRHIPSLQPGNNQITVQVSSPNRLGLSIILFLEKKKDGVGAYTILVYSHTSETHSNNAMSRQDQENAFDKKTGFDKANSRRNMRRNIHTMRCLVKIILKANDNLRFV